jgi:excisionase family DNA binding protein
MAQDQLMDQPPVYTPAQVAERLQVSLVWVKRALRAGVLPGFRVGRLWRVTAEDLQAFIAAHRPHGAGKEAT